MDIKRPVFWHQGLFLQPQHFQLTDQHHQFQLTPYREAGLPHFWGVAQMALQESALADRRFVLASGSFLFPGGEYVEFPGNAIVPPRSFDAEWTEGDKPFAVWLGLRRLSDATPNVAVVKSLAEASSERVRYLTTADADEVADLFHQGPSAQVKRLTCLVRVFFAHEVEGLADYDLIPVALLQRDGGKIVPSRRFVPPCVGAQASPALMDILRELRDSVAGRARTLEEYKVTGAMGKGDFDPAGVLSLLALATLNRYAPLLTHYCEGGAVHPWSVYGTVRQMLGELSTFTARFNMQGEAP
ncbi:MAG: type VI secretion system baseplate subunit TssK, partial [Nitrospinae bacterium]|nr:type VI secretion system baseplate subunit TssK [Nitrospinota bacterium]